MSTTRSVEETIPTPTARPHDRTQHHTQLEDQNNMPTSQEEERRVTTAVAEESIPTQTMMHPPDPTYEQAII